MAADRRWRPPGTVRVRTTVAALLVVGVAMVVGGVIPVAAHGGTVGLAGSPLGGARVEVSLPRHAG